MLSAISTMVSGALRDRMVGVGVMAAAVLLVLTAWVLAVAAVVVLVVDKLGMAGGLLAVSGGLVLLALILVLGTRARSRSSATERSATRALWVATAVNAASMMLRRDTQSATAHPASDTATAASEAGPAANHRSILLIVGGLALILLALFIPSGKDDASDRADAEPDADPQSDPETGV